MFVVLGTKLNVIQLPYGNTETDSLQVLYVCFHYNSGFPVLWLALMLIFIPAKAFTIYIHVGVQARISIDGITTIFGAV